MSLKCCTLNSIQPVHRSRIFVLTIILQEFPSMLLSACVFSTPKCHRRHLPLPPWFETLTSSMSFCDVLQPSVSSEFLFCWQGVWCTAETARAESAPQDSQVGLRHLHTACHAAHSAFTCKCLCKCHNISDGYGDNDRT